MSREGEGMFEDKSKCPICGGILSYRVPMGMTRFIKGCTTCAYLDFNTSRHNLRKNQVMIWTEDRRKKEE